jgi:hypothetical protein
VDSKYYLAQTQELPSAHVKKVFQQINLGNPVVQRLQPVTAIVHHLRVRLLYFHRNWTCLSPYQYIIDNGRSAAALRGKQVDQFLFFTR